MTVYNQAVAPSDDDTLPPLPAGARPEGPEELPWGTRAGEWVIHDLIGRGGPAWSTWPPASATG